MTAAESILKAAATVPHVVAADAIVLAADCTVTRTDAVREQNEKIVRLGKADPGLHRIRISNQNAAGQPAAFLIAWIRPLAASCPA